MRRRRSRFAIGAGLLLLATPLFASPADDVRSRVSNFRELGASFKTVNDAIRTPEPQVMLVQIAARQIANSARQMPGWFPAGSGPESGAKTKAKAEIWKQAPKFKAAQDAFAAQAIKFQQAAQSGNVTIMRAAARNLGMTCKGCHDSFRQPGD